MRAVLPVDCRWIYALATFIHAIPAMQPSPPASSAIQTLLKNQLLYGSPPTTHQKPQSVTLRATPSRGGAFVLLTTFWCNTHRAPRMVLPALTREAKTDRTMAILPSAHANGTLHQ